MSFYEKYILPKFLDVTMKSPDINKLRPEVVKAVSGTVLEIGFGSGLNLPYYSNVSKLYALEPSKELFDLAKERIAKTSFPVEYLPDSAESISLPDKSVDSVISTWTLCTIPHPEKALDEIRRVLKPGGIFTFIEHGKSPKGAVGFFQKIFTPISKLIAGGCHLDRNIETLLRESGLKIEHLEKFEIKRKPLAYMYKGTALN